MGIVRDENGMSAFSIGKVSKDQLGAVMRLLFEKFDGVSVFHVSTGEAVVIIGKDACVRR